MGNADCLNLLDSWEPADYIDCVGIFINAALAVWIVRTIQNKLTNRRVLKDHFINELKEIRSDYKTCLNNLYSGQTHAIKVIPWFKLMSIKTNDLMRLINLKYGIDSKFLNPYQNELRELITENEEYISHYKSNSPIIFSDLSKTSLMRFQQDYNHLFNDIIVVINDHE